MDYGRTEIRNCGSPGTREDAPPLNYDCTRDSAAWNAVVLLCGFPIDGGPKSLYNTNQRNWG